MANLLRIGELHDVLARSTPQLRRGKTWCLKCGRELDVDSAEFLRRGWPKCGGQTMSLDSPEERRAMEAAAK